MFAWALVTSGPTPFYFLTLKVPIAVVECVDGPTFELLGQMGHIGVLRSIFLALAMSRDPSREAKHPASFSREQIEIACARPVAGRCGRSWQARRSRRAVGFLAPVAPIKPKGSAPGFHTLPSHLQPSSPIALGFLHPRPSRCRARIHPSPSSNGFEVPL